MLLHSIGFFCLALVLLGEGTPSFDKVSEGSGILSEGNSLDLLCKVNNLTEDYSIYWYRTTKTGDRTAIYRDGMLINNDLGREAEAYSSHSINVLITQLRGRDLGRLLNDNIYTCEIISKSSGEAVLVSSGIILEARYPPSPLYPICKSCNFSSEFIGSSVNISCYSEPGEPIVHLKWTRNGKKVENLQPTLTNSYVYLNYTFNLEADDLGAIFQCETTQRGKELRTCNLERDPLSNCDSAPTPTETPLSNTTFIIQTDKDEKEKSQMLVIVLSVIIAVLVTFVVIEAAINIYLLRKLRRCQKAGNGMEITTSPIPDPALDYKNVKQSNIKRDLETYSDLKPREEANYSSLQNLQHKENKQDLEMMSTVPDPAYEYNVKQLTDNRSLETYADLQPRAEANYSSLQTNPQHKQTSKI